MILFEKSYFANIKIFNCKGQFACFGPTPRKPNLLYHARAMLNLIINTRTWCVMIPVFPQ